MNLTRLSSVVMITLIFASLAGYLAVTVYTTMTFASSKNVSQVEEKTSNQELAANPSPVHLRGDPIDDPKPNSK